VGVTELLHTVHGQDGPAAVVNDHIYAELRALPELSLIAVLKFTVYVEDAASELLGVSVATRVAGA
jgi:hypothetical protein